MQGQSKGELATETMERKYAQGIQALIFELFLSLLVLMLSAASSIAQQVTGKRTPKD